MCLCDEEEELTGDERAMAGKLGDECDRGGGEWRPSGAFSNMTCKTSISEALGKAFKALSVGDNCSWNTLQPYLAARM
jgi:hypothetical protein